MFFSRKPSVTKKSLVVVGIASAGLLGLSSCGAEADAENYPSDTISIVVPYAAGGAADIHARALEPFIEEELGADVVVENVPGASGALGQQEMMQQPADGHTIQMVASTAMSVGPLQQDVGYTLEDVKIVGMYAELPTVLVIHADSEYDSAEEFLDAADSQEMRIATHGAISQGALAVTQLNEDHGKNFTVVPYDGQAEATTALLGKNVDAMLVGTSDSAREYFDSGELLPIAIDANQGVEYLPDVPTFADLGYEDVRHGMSYYGVGVHAETPDEIRDQLEELLAKAIEDPGVLEQIGEEYVPSEFVPGDELQQRYEEQSSVYEGYIDSVSAE